MNELKSKSSQILCIAGLVISIFMTAGVKLLFPACGVHEDGSFGSCHWAEQAVLAAGLVLILQNLIMVLIKSRNTQQAVSVCMAGTAVVTALIPGCFIRLCMMPSMRCIASMQPAVIICAVILALLGLCNLLLNRQKGTHDR